MTIPHRRLMLVGSFAGIIAFVVGAILVGIFTVPDTPLASPAAPSSGPAAGNEASILESLGKAYAKDAGLRLDGFETSSAWDLGSNRTEWRKRLGEALSVGYAPAEENRFAPIPWSALKNMMKLEMGKGRTPEQVLDQALASGSRVVQSTWRFASQKPVTSYAIFNLNHEILFDTLLSFPVIRIPVFEVRHF